MTEEAQVEESAGFEEEFDNFVNGDAEEPFESDEENESEPTDQVADLPDEQQSKFDDLRKQNEDLQHRINSDNGRVSALQRKINDLESVQTKEPAPTEQEIHAAIKNPEKWAEVKEDYPELAEGLETFVQSQIEARLKKVDEISAKMGTFETRAAAEDRRSEISKLTDKHPDWSEVAVSSEFKGWVSHQPEKIQSLVNSEEAADAAYLLEAYKSTIPVKSTGQTQAEKITAQRQKKLAAAEETPTQRRTPTPADESDFFGAFERYAKQRER